MLLLAAATITCGTDRFDAGGGTDPAAIAVVRGAGQVGLAGQPVPDPVVVEVSDADGRPVPGSQVSFALTTGGPGASLTPTVATTDASGRASARVVLPTAPGSIGAEARVSDRQGHVFAARFAATATAGQGDSVSRIAGEDQGGRVGAALADSLVVLVTDRYGNPAAGVQLQWSVTGGGAVSDPGTATGADGRTGIIRTLGSAAGGQTTTATASGLKGSPVIFHHLAVPLGASALLPVSGGGQTGPVATVLANDLVVQVQDALGNPLSGRAIAWHAEAGSGSLQAGAAATDATGKVTARWTLGTSAGEQLVTVSASGLEPVTFRATATGGAPATFAIVTQPPTSARSGVAFTRAPRVAMRDAWGNPSPAEGVRVTVGLGTGAGGLLEGTLAVNSADGEATFGDLVITGPIGEYTLRFSAPGVAPLGSASIDLASGPPASVTVTTQPSATAEGWLPLTRQPVIQVRDGGGNLVDGVDVAASIESGGGTLSGTTTVTTDAGVARFTNLAIGGADGDRILRFDAGSAFATSDPVSVVARPEAIAGRWSDVFPWPVVAIHLHVLPDGRVLSWGKAGQPQLWDPATGNFTAVPAPIWVFCSGHSFLPDGRLFVAGGHIDDSKGLPDATYFDWRTNAWSSGQPMSWGRWYPTTTVLPNGEVLTTAGTDTAGADVLVPEVLHQDGSWRRLTGAPLRLPWYPKMFVAPDGRVFLAGPAPRTRYLNTSGTGHWSDLVARMNVVYRAEGAAVMYQPGKILTMGGGDSTSTISHNSAEVIDLNQAAPQWRLTAPMQFGRRQLNATLLPTGEVLVTGGTSIGVNNPAGAIHAAEVWSPETGQWTTLAANQMIRIYHSTSVLLPDGRVLHTGSGEGQGSPIQRNAELFSPPYLFRGQRPVIAAAPALVGYGQNFQVETPQAANIAKVSWVRLGSTTHTFDENQRFMSLGFTAGSGALTVRAPANANLAPPGHYMLFVVDGAGVPSVAKILQIQ